MTEHAVTHATFALDRSYPVPPERVFAAWADTATKRRWFAGGNSSHQLDFRVGGLEVNRATHDGKEVLFESLYRDIVAHQRIVYTSVLSENGRPATVSLTTVQLHATDAGTRLILTEQGTFLDELEEPAWREHCTGDWLDALGADLGVTSRLRIDHDHRPPSRLRLLLGRAPPAGFSVVSLTTIQVSDVLLVHASFRTSTRIRPDSGALYYRCGSRL